MKRIINLDLTILLLAVVLAFCAFTTYGEVVKSEKERPNSAAGASKPTTLAAGNS